MLQSLRFFDVIPLWRLFTDIRWSPLIDVPPSFGIYALFVGTLTVTFFALLIAVPFGLITAVFLSEYAPGLLASWIKPILEILVGIPSIVYGFFALTFITPLLRSFFPDVSVYNALSASIAMGFMILPLVSSFSQDAIHAVPNTLRNAGYALGLTKWEVTRGIVLPSAQSGIFASIVLAISRAIGETMIVAIAAGSLAKTTFNPFEQVLTLTGYIAQISTSDVAFTSAPFLALYPVALILFLFTLALNTASDVILHRKEKKI